MKKQADILPRTLVRILTGRGAYVCPLLLLLYESRHPPAVGGCVPFEGRPCPTLVAI